MERIVEAPRNGTYHLSEDGSINFVGTSYDQHEVTHEDEAFIMRDYGPGDYRFKGADLDILVTKGQMQTADGLTERPRRWIDGIRRMYVSEPLEVAPPVVSVPAVN